MAGEVKATSETADVVADEAARSGIYALLAKLLSDIPDQYMLTATANLAADGRAPLGAAINELASAAHSADAVDLSDEFHDLFIGVGRGELLPFGSYYLTGFLHEKPLAALRETMSELGITADPTRSEPEDHIASVLEIMATLVAGEQSSEQVGNWTADRFFAVHVSPWAPKFFQDLEQADGARFYRHVGRIGSQFLEIEQQALAMS